MDIKSLAVMAVLVIVSGGVASAAPPSPEVADGWKRTGIYAEKTRAWQEWYALQNRFTSGRRSDDATLVDSVHLAVIMVDFDDWPYDGQAISATPHAVDRSLFAREGGDSSVAPYGSFADYFREVSYGRLEVDGTVYGWYRMPRPYSWYVYYDQGLQRGGQLVRDACALADSTGVDFSVHDADHDGVCDAVIIVHAGSGAEGSAEAAGIWTHSSSLSSGTTHDGIGIRDYIIGPEEYGGAMASIGVYCQEYAHLLGAPYLYRLDSENGTVTSLGLWSLMATGCWNESGCRPAHPDGVSREILGWLVPVTVGLDNLAHVSLPQVESEPLAYRLPAVGSASGEYWLVENRGPVGFDGSLPGEGLMIYHVDPSLEGVPDSACAYITVEQADGRDDLGPGGNMGDTGDPWPGDTQNRSFNAVSVPAPVTRKGEGTQVAVWDISEADSVMTADLDVTYSRPFVTREQSDSTVFNDAPPGGDGDGLPEPGETVFLNAAFRNQMRTVYNVWLVVESNHPQIVMSADSAFLADEWAAGSSVVATSPVSMTIPLDIVARPTVIRLTVRSDSLCCGAGDRTFAAPFAVERQIGAAQVLLVDDDGGAAFEGAYKGCLDRAAVDYAVWDCRRQGSPPVEVLQSFSSVIWLGGDRTDEFLDEGEIAILTDFLQRGGNLMVSGFGMAAELEVTDPSFLHDRLCARYRGFTVADTFRGLSGHPLAEGTTYCLDDSSFMNQLDVVTPVNSGRAVFAAGLLTDTTVCGVAHEGPGKTVFMTFPWELLHAQSNGAVYPRDTLLLRTLSFFAGTITDVADDDNGQVLLPQGPVLEPSYPNPFNPTTTIRFYLPSAESGGRNPVRLTIHNILGQKVATLIDETMTAGRHEVVWDGRTASGRPAASGVYLARLGAGGRVRTLKLVLVR